MSTVLHICRSNRRNAGRSEALGCRVGLGCVHMWAQTASLASLSESVRLVFGSPDIVTSFASHSYEFQDVFDGALSASARACARVRTSGKVGWAERKEAALDPNAKGFGNSHNMAPDSESIRLNPLKDQ